jgi:hypothetical protein
MLAGQRDAGVRRSDSDLLVGVADAVLLASQQINRESADKLAIQTQADALKSMLDGIAFESLTAEGQAAYIGLAREQKRLAEEWRATDNKAALHKQLVAPDTFNLPSGVQIDAASLVVDSPKVAMNNAEFSTPLGPTYTGRGGSLDDRVNVNVNLATAPVTLYLDNYAVSQGMLKVMPEVTKSLGGGGGTYSYIKTLE